MLSMQEIRQEFPKWLQHQERFMLREYLQHLILRLIYSSPYATKLQFIWWTALRLFHKTQRFSEDLDFDNSDLHEHEFVDMIRVVVTWLQSYWFDVQRNTKNKNAMHGYIKFLGILSSYDLAPTTRREIQEKLLIRIDTHDQWYNFVPDKNILRWFGVQSVVHVASPSLLMSQKILTIWERKRSKGRDFYDLVHLISKNVVPDYQFLEQKLWIVNADGIISYLWNIVSEKNMKALQDDIAPFLFHTHDDSVLNFDTYVQGYGF